MRSAIGGCSSIESFRKRTRYGDGLDRAIEQGLRDDPARALAKINIEDPEITAELTAIVTDKAALKLFVEGIPKHPIPDIDLR
jgi:hypothetical protein